MNTLERIQYHAALAVTGSWKGTSLNRIYDELGWESLTDRRGAVVKGVEHISAIVLVNI